MCGINTSNTRVYMLEKGIPRIIAAFFGQGRRSIASSVIDL